MSKGFIYTSDNEYLHVWNLALIMFFLLQVTFDINMYTDRKQSKETKNVVSKRIFAPHSTI